MAFFDTICFNCQNCNKIVRVKSTAGRCNFNEYEDLHNIPFTIANELDNKIIRCPHCETAYIIELVDVYKIASIKISLSDKNKDDEVEKLKKRIKFLENLIEKYESDD